MKARQRIIASSLCALMSASALPFAAFAANGVSIERMSLKDERKLIRKIDCSREPSEAEKRLLLDYYRKESEEVFSERYAKQSLAQGLAEIAASQEGDAVINGEANNYSLGAVGNILVTYSYSSLGVEVSVPGHAAIVSTNAAQTVEAFPSGGVRFYTNDWKTKKNVYGLQVKNAGSVQYKNAAKYAMKQADAKKPYNWNYFNKGTTSSFYCSQLVWKAWKEQGFDIDAMNLGNYEPVSPAELVKSSATQTFYHK